MKISTLALGALICFSTASFAQVKSAQKDKTAKATKCHKPKTTAKKDSSNSQINKPKRHSARYCPGCGMG
jgi:hypothetical protein